MKKTRIVILGGGFAGLRAAMYFDKGLARQTDIEVTLVSRDNFTLFTPMLHEVASGDLYGGDIINPIRRILHHVRFVESDVESVDCSGHVVRCTSGVETLHLDLQYDHLLLALGSETNFFDLPGVSDWAITIKSLSDAALLRNRVVALLEQASLRTDPAVRQRMLTFVTAGGGFAGTETTGSLNDYVRDTLRFYPELTEDMVRVVVVHSGTFLLPELGEELGNYAEKKLRERKVEVIKGVRVSSYDGAVITLDNGSQISAQTLLWTAGVKPSSVTDALPCRKVKNRVAVNEFLTVPELSGVWAAGDSAAVPDIKAGKLFPPTAQHGLREGLAVAKNIEATILGHSMKPFVYKTQGQLATIGRHTGVAMVFGFKFSGFLAWWMWRTVYLAKLPRWPKKLRVVMDWTLDLFFGREIEQTINVRDIDALSQRLSRLRARMRA
ncbi:MAG: dehydrogenase [Verrucomicrobiales bacterium]|nr:dehydrogenase [Verrucomicrobiales bacterium]